MAHWMSVPELEAALREMNEQSPDLGVLCSAVTAIVKTLNRPAKIVSREEIVIFEYPGLIFHNVRLRDEEYHVRRQHEAAQVDLIYGYTDELAWRVCGYPCSPAEMREAKKRAENLGINTKKLPGSFFRPRRRAGGVHGASPQT